MGDARLRNGIYQLVILDYSTTMHLALHPQTQSTSVGYLESRCYVAVLRPFLSRVAGAFLLRHTRYSQNSLGAREVLGKNRTCNSRILSTQGHASSDTRAESF